MSRTLSLALITILLAGAAIGLVTTDSGAQQSATCPADTTLSADGMSCLSDAVDDNVTTTTTCTVGVLSEDGTQCLVPRLDQAPAPAATGGGAGSGVVEAPVPSFTG